MYHSYIWNIEIQVYRLIVKEITEGIISIIILKNDILPSGIPSGGGPYFTVNPLSRPNTDTI